MAEQALDIERWLEAARSGSKAALGEALEACRNYLLMIANRGLDAELRAKGGASDLVQETFLEAQRDFPQFSGATDVELRAWLNRMLVNNLANFARHYRGTTKRQIDRERALQADSTSQGPGTGLAADTPTPSRQAVSREEASAVESAIARLPEDYRRVIILRNQEDRPFDEIARLMERSENAVRKLWFRAIEQLQQELEAS
ncbi:MAG: sigma-70 family RNA polymerase sigma factor [Gemmataceae bacterium]|nr:sigma-70 family RNA polymerase sigma factor [Gemmataceae bacterium]